MSKLIPKAFLGIKTRSLREAERNQRTRDLIELYGADNYAKFKAQLERAYNADLALKAEASRLARVDAITNRSRRVAIPSPAQITPPSLKFRNIYDSSPDAQQMRYMARNYTPEDRAYFNEVVSRPSDGLLAPYSEELLKKLRPLKQEPKFKSFDEAFRYYRKQGAETFDYKGKKYTTELAGEAPVRSSSKRASDNKSFGKLAQLTDQELNELIAEKNSLNGLSEEDRARGIVGRREDGKVARIVPSIKPEYQKYIRPDGTFNEMQYRLDKNRDAIDYYKNQKPLDAALRDIDETVAFARKHNMPIDTDQDFEKARIRREQTELPRRQWSKAAQDLRYNADKKRIDDTTEAIGMLMYEVPALITNPLIVGNAKAGIGKGIKQIFRKSPKKILTNGNSGADEIQQFRNLLELNWFSHPNSDNFLESLRYGLYNGDSQPFRFYWY